MRTVDRPQDEKFGHINWREAGIAQEVKSVNELLKSRQGAWYTFDAWNVKLVSAMKRHGLRPCIVRKDHKRERLYVMPR